MISGRAKVIADIAELVPLLRAVNKDTKREVFDEISKDWVAGSEIAEKYGEEGKEALASFEQMKLLETKWQPTEKGAERVYKSFYTTVRIDLTTPIPEVTDVLRVVMMSKKRFKEYENKVLRLIGEGEKYVGDVSKELKISQTMLRSLANRSTKFVYKGQMIVRL